MADILLTWLNTEVDLSKKIKNIEQDFSNGYLFGELLYKFNQLTNFRDFQNSDYREAKIKNFVLLERVFENIKVPFNTIKAKKIMDGERGCASKLLYQIRSTLEKKGMNFENLSMKKSLHIQEMYSPMKFKKDIASYDNLSQKFFLERIQFKTRAQKEINMEEKLAKYEEFKKNEDHKIKEIIDKKDKMKEKDLLIRMNSMRAQNQKFHNFQQKYEQQGIDEWKKNMICKKEREKKDLNYELKEAEKYKNNVYNSISNCINDMEKKINDFEQSLQNSNQNDISNIQNSETEQKNRRFYKSSLLSEKMKADITEKIMLNSTAKRERDRRRRKIIVEQGKAQLEIENKRREEHLIQKLNKQSNQEKQLNYESFRVEKNKDIILQNRKLRDLMYEERYEMEMNFMEKNEEEFLKVHKENFSRDLDKEEIKKKDLEISLNERKRTVNSNLCRKMVELIVDISEDAYLFQQINDTDEIDPRQWREWTQLFINNQSVKSKANIGIDRELLSRETVSTPLIISPIANNMLSEKNSTGNNFNKDNNSSALSKEKNEPKVDYQNNLTTHTNLQIAQNTGGLNVDSNYNTGYGENTFYSGTAYSYSDKILDECEFIDYINYQGQWSRILIPEKAFSPINLIELFSEPTNQLSAPKDPKQKQTQVSQKEEYKEEDPENLAIFSEEIKNFYLGDIIDILVDIKYCEEENSSGPFRKFIFSHIPVKICIIGNDFSGKKTQAKILSENFPFKIYNMEELIQHALDTSNKYDFQAEVNIDLGEVIQSNRLKQIQQERKIQEEKYSKIKEIGGFIQTLLLNGDAIPDEIYVDLLVENIKIDFPEKSKEEIFDEAYNRVKRKEEINDEFERNAEDKIKRPRAYQKLEQELNEELAKISLDATKGFVIVNFPNTYNQAKLLEGKISGFVAEIERGRTESLSLKESYAVILDKSAKISPISKLIESGIDFIFHLKVPALECIRRAIGRRLHPQSGEIYHLDDNLPPISSTGNTCEKLVPIENIFNSEATLATRHLSFENNISLMYEFYENFGFEKERLKTLNTILSDREKDYITQELIELINRLVAINEYKDNELVEKSSEDEEGEVSENSAIDNNIMVQNQSNSVNILNNNKDISYRSGDNTLEKVNNDITIKNKIEEIEIEDEYVLYVKKIEAIKKALNKDLVDILFKIWTKIFENYTRESKNIFKFLRIQRDTVSNYFNMISQKFIEFLKRPSKKQAIVLDFQMKYNKFIDDYPDLVDDIQVKEEHHQCVDDLNDKIYEIIEMRKIESVDERKKIMTAGWIENEMEKFYLNLEKLFQNEADKFLGSLQIIRDYYHNLDNRPLIEIPFHTFDIIKEEVDPTPLEVENDTNSFPRVDKLYKIGLKVQFLYDDALMNAEKNRLAKLAEKEKEKAKAPPATKIDPKKKPEQKLPEIGIEEKKPEVYQYENEMKQSIKNEKAKYRFRLTLLKHWGVECLKNLRKIANSIYSKLDDWIILSIKAENEALSQLCNMLRDHIEQEKKIKYELELDTFDVIVNMDVQNYIELPPQPLPAKEIIDHSKFNIVQLRILLDELKTYEINHNFIRTSTFLEIFIKKYISSKNNNDVYYGIPDLLRKLSFHNFFKFIKYLDPNSTDQLSLKNIGTYFCIMTSKVITSDNEHALKSQVDKIAGFKEPQKLTREQFLKIPMWFDANESSPTLNMYEDYNRVEKLKDIIFEINKDDDNYLNFGEFLKILNLRSIYLDNEKYRDKTYYEILFF